MIEIVPAWCWATELIDGRDEIHLTLDQSRTLCDMVVDPEPFEDEALLEAVQHTGGCQKCRKLVASAVMKVMTDG